LRIIGFAEQIFFVEVKTISCTASKSDVSVSMTANRAPISFASFTISAGHRIEADHQVGLEDDSIV
jgi:hypothetical protein